MSSFDEWLVEHVGEGGKWPYEEPFVLAKDAYNEGLRKAIEIIKEYRNSGEVAWVYEYDELAELIEKEIDND